MPDYIPAADDAFDHWFESFKTYFAANAVALGFAAADATTVTNSFTAWSGNLSAHISAVQAAKGARSTKDQSKNAAKAVIRSYVKRIQANPATTDTQRAALGITIPDGTRTPAQPPTDAPFMVLDWSQRGRVIVHAGTNPTNEQVNKMGPHAKNLLIQFRPVDGEWEYLAVVSSSPFVHIVGNVNPTTLEYRSAYLNSKGVMGPWSAVVTAYVSAAA